MIQLDGRTVLVIFVFLICLAVSSVKTFGLLSGITPPNSAYVIAFFFAVFLYIIFFVGKSSNQGLGMK